MTAPFVQITTVDGMLGISEVSTSSNIAILAYGSLATVGNVYDYANASATTVRTELGRGKGPTAVAGVMSTPNHGGVVFVPMAFTAGTVAATTSTGTSPPAVATTGAPHDDAHIRVEILQAGARGTATFRYCVDFNPATGLGTWSTELVTAATYTGGDLANLGITLTFANTGPYAVDNRYSIVCTAPTHSNTQITDALEILKASGRDVEWIFVLSANGGATDTDRMTAWAATSAAVGAKVAQFTTANRPVGCTIEGPAPVATDTAGMASWRSAYNTAAAAVSDLRVAVALGPCRKISDIDSLNCNRNAIFPVLERFSSAPLHEDLGRVNSGALRGVTSIMHDEETTGGLNSARATTLTTISGRNGFYITEGRQLASPGSDFDLSQMLRVINRAIRVGRGRLLTYLNDSIIVDAGTGRIREDEAVAIDADLKGALEAALLQPGHCSAVSASVSREDNILSTRTLTGEFSITPLGYMKAIKFKAGFSRTATTLALAA